MRKQPSLQTVSAQFGVFYSIDSTVQNGEDGTGRDGTVVLYRSVSSCPVTSVVFLKGRTIFRAVQIDIAKEDVTHT